MLAKRIIPTLLKRGRNLVKGQQFKSWRVVGHALQSVRTHNARGVDELIFLDIGATPDGRGPDFDLVAELTEDCFMPVTVGGGVKNLDDAKRLLRAGADKVAVCTGGPGLMYEIAVELGSQAVVACLDARDGKAVISCGRTPTQYDIVAYAKACEIHGAGEIMLTSITHEGTLNGYDLDIIRIVSDAVRIPVIAHGGCGTPDHMLQAIQCGASAVAAGAMFQFTDVVPKDCAQYLHEHGWEVRL